MADILELEERDGEIWANLGALSQADGGVVQVLTDKELDARDAKNYRAGLEAAAKVCEKVADLPALNSYFDARAEGARILAGRIRALKDAP